MTFTRISILGSTGLVLLQLIACSADLARKNSGAPDERLDSNTVGSDATTKVSTGDASTPDDCDWHKGEAIVADKIKWKNTLERPREFVATNGSNAYTVTVLQKDVQMLPEKCYPKTKVFAYGGSTIGYGESEPRDAWSSPGPTFEMTHGVEAHVTWLNGIDVPHLFPIDPTLHWANPDKLEPPTGPFDKDFKNPAADSPVPIVTHVHGLEVAPDSDGHPNGWFTRNVKKDAPFEPVPFEHGEWFKKDGPSVYPNTQPATTLWYHDHALGVTRLNVYAGLAGMYIIREENDPVAAFLPDKAHEMPLVIQDKTFDNYGQLVYTEGGGAHPYWSGSFSGETMVVNGKAMPKMDVERTRYRFRVLNGGNNQNINLTLPGLTVPDGELPFTIIGSDGGYLAAPVGSGMLMLAPGERADIVIDFSLLKPGDTVVLKNGAKEVVQFVALATEAKPTCALQSPQSSDQKSSAEPPLPLCFKNGLSKIPALVSTSTRTVTLNSAEDGTYFLNGRSFHSEADEKPKLGTTEEWDIVNLTYEEHPIHLHLVQFQVLNREALKVDDNGLPLYPEAWNEANDGGAVPLQKPAVHPALTGFISGKIELPKGADTGWKDTVTAPSFTVTRILVRWAPQDAVKFAFHAEQKPGYVWHCHMLEHEDHDMMRPLEPVEPSKPVNP